MTRGLISTDGVYPRDAPLFWYAAALMRAHRITPSWSPDDGPIAVVAAFGKGCNASATTPGMFVAPNLDDARLVDDLSSNRGPILLVGGAVFLGWSQSAAARLRSAEVLQLSDIGPTLEIGDDVSASLRVLDRVLGRFDSLLARIERSGDL